jgi:hypothetical protein
MARHEEFEDESSQEDCDEKAESLPKAVMRLSRSEDQASSPSFKWQIINMTYNNLIAVN